MTRAGQAPRDDAADKPEMRVPLFARLRGHVLGLLRRAVGTQRLVESDADTRARVDALSAALRAIAAEQRTMLQAIEAEQRTMRRHLEYVGNSHAGAVTRAQAQDGRLQSDLLPDC